MPIYWILDLIKGKYNIVVKDENNCEQKDSAILQKAQHPGQFEIEGDSIACEGDEIELITDINTQIILQETVSRIFSQLEGITF